MVEYGITSAIVDPTDGFAEYHDVQVKIAGEGVEVAGMFEPVWAIGTLKTTALSSELTDVVCMIMLDETEPYRY